jgi:hypothetical protein
MIIENLENELAERCGRDVKGASLEDARSQRPGHSNENPEVEVVRKHHRMMGNRPGSFSR